MPCVFDLPPLDYSITKLGIQLKFGKTRDIHNLHFTPAPGATSTIPQPRQLQPLTSDNLANYLIKICFRTRTIVAEMCLLHSPMISSDEEKWEELTKRQYNKLSGDIDWRIHLMYAKSGRWDTWWHKDSSPRMMLRYSAPLYSPWLAGDQAPAPPLFSSPDRESCHPAREQWSVSPGTSGTLGTADHPDTPV